MRRARLLAGAAMLALAVAAPRGAHAQAPAEDEETEVLVGDAHDAIGRHDYARAAQLLDRALKGNPRRIDLYVLRASVHGVAGEHDRAIALLERAHQLAPDNENVMTALGTELVQVGQAGRGVPMLEAIVTRAPRRYEAQAVLGHYYATQGQWHKAAVALDAYFTHRPGEQAGEDQLSLDRAAATLRDGDAVTARRLYMEILAKKKHSEAARLGIAWSVAATDCREALPMLDRLGDLEAKYAEVALVRGRCALLLGRFDDALGAVERYRKARPDDAQGWALLGDAQFGRKNLTAAEAAYTRAAAAAGKNRLYAFELARTERLLGKPKDAAPRLAGGPPPGYEDDWRIEYGETLYALGQAKALDEHIAAWADAHPDHATGQFLHGAARLALGDSAGAVPLFEKAHAHGEARAARPLIDALNTQADAAVAGAPGTPPDLGKARALLAHASQIGDDVLTWRNLGAVLLAQGDVDGATKILRKAADRGKDDPVALHLFARAAQANKSYDEARAAYARAIRAYGKDPRGLVAASDLAGNEMAAGRGEQAVDALTGALAAAPDADTRTRLGKQLIEVARATATDAMRGGRFAVAVRLLKELDKVTADPAVTGEIRCDLALAATGAGQRDAALEQLRKLEAAKTSCPFVPPADELAVPILIAWNEGASVRKAAAALARLDRIRSRARGDAEPLARMAGRDIALRSAQEAYAAGGLRQAAAFLASAKLYDRSSPELAHDLAVLQLAGGDVDGAIAELERVKDEVPEAYINLGIAYDRKHEPLRALEAWKRAAALGVRWAPLREWIDAKVRFWGDGASAGGAP
jgi:tetratricopeptide (TPR) repeat protein